MKNKCRENSAPLQNSLHLEDRNLELLLLASHPTVGVGLVTASLVVSVLPVLLGTLGSEGCVALGLVPTALLHAGPVLEDGDDAGLAVVLERSRVALEGNIAVVVGVTSEEILLGVCGLG